MSNIYLCGPVTGNGQAVHSFKSVEEKIWNAAQNSGITIYTYNPVRICPPGFTWHLAMRVCVRELSRCHGIALLQGWQRSKGAALELKLAQDLHIPVVCIEPPFDYLDMSALFTAAPETLRYYNARLVQFHREGVEESLAEDRAAAELANRYLDPYGFEYIDIGEEG